MLDVEQNGLLVDDMLDLLQPENLLLLQDLDRIDRLQAKPS